MWDIPQLDADRQHYVYCHVCPVTQDLLYVGRGTGQRAWMSMGGYDDTRYGHRSPVHSQYLSKLLRYGFLPNDWVHIEEKGLSISEASKLESHLIWELNPRFNRPNGKHLLRMTKEMLVKASELRERGETYKAIAKVLNVSPMTVHRALTGQTKNLSVLI